MLTNIRCRIRCSIRTAKFASGKWRGRLTLVLDLPKALENNFGFKVLDVIKALQQPMGFVSRIWQV